MPKPPICPDSHREPPKPSQPCCEPSTPKSSGGILPFLRRLLPRQIDTDDLLIILLILLMNREEDPDGLSPLLTLALYFLM